MTLKENIQTNKTKAWYFLGIIIAACFKEVVETIQPYLEQDTWWGDSLLVLTGYAIVAVSIIAPLIFGKEAEIERVKKERKDNGIELSRVVAENNAYDVTNKLQADLLNQHNLTSYRYEGFQRKKNVKELPQSGDIPETTLEE